MGLLGWQKLAGARASGSLGRSTQASGWTSLSRISCVCFAFHKAGQLQEKQFHGSAIWAGIAQHFLGTGSKMSLFLNSGCTGSSNFLTVLHNWNMLWHSIWVTKLRREGRRIRLRIPRRVWKTWSKGIAINCSDAHLHVWHQLLPNSWHQSLRFPLPPACICYVALRETMAPRYCRNSSSLYPSNTWCSLKPDFHECSALPVAAEISEGSAS